MPHIYTPCPGHENGQRRWIFIQRRLFKLSVDERKRALRDAIRCKCKYPISTAQLDYILARLNIHRTYLIKTMSDPNKFLNIATSEYIETRSKILLSQIFPLYGEFTPGVFEKTVMGSNTPVRGFINSKLDAAAVKITLSYLPSGELTTTYTLFLYQSGRNMD